MIFQKINQSLESYRILQQGADITANRGRAVSKQPRGVSDAAITARGHISCPGRAPAPSPSLRHLLPFLPAPSPLLIPSPDPSPMLHSQLLGSIPTPIPHPPLHLQPNPHPLPHSQLLFGSIPNPPPNPSSLPRPQSPYSTPISTPTPLPHSQFLGSTPTPIPIPIPIPSSLAPSSAPSPRSSPAPEQHSRHGEVGEGPHAVSHRPQPLFAHGAPRTDCATAAGRPPAGGASAALRSPSPRCAVRSCAGARSPDPRSPIPHPGHTAFGPRSSSTAGRAAPAARCSALVALPCSSRSSAWEKRSRAQGDAYTPSTLPNALRR